MTTHYMKAEGGLHQRIWFAKAGRGTHQDIGISPVAEQHLANGTYSFSLAGFDPFEMDLKEATAAGKETSLYPGMGAQFGAQIWRMAHEAQVGDYIFLESENHNLHAVGVITGPYQLFAEDYNETTLTKEGLHAVPVLWYPIKNGMGVIQLGRLDNAVFRDIMGKEKLVNLLFDLTQPYIANGLYKPGQSPAQPGNPKAKPSASLAAEPAAQPTPAPPPPAPVMPDALTTPIHVARSGGFIYENIDDARLADLIRSKMVAGTDDYFRHGMRSWMKVSQYALMKGIPLQ